MPDLPGARPACVPRVPLTDGRGAAGRWWPAAAPPVYGRGESVQLGSALLAFIAFEGNGPIVRCSGPPQQRRAADP